MPIRSRLVSLLSITLLTSIAAMLSVQTAVAADPIRIGFVNTAQLLEEAPQAEAGSRKLEAEFSPRQRRLVELQQEVQRLEERLGRDEAVLSEGQKRELERDVVAKRRDLRRGEDEFREDLNLRRNEELARVQQLIFETIVKVADEGGYDLILSDGVLLATERVDLTRQVLQRLSRNAERAN